MINIQDIIPFMKDGWVAMDKNGSWVWFEQKPICRPVLYDIWRIDDGLICPLHCFDIAPADDWTKSLIRIKGKNNE